MFGATPVFTPMGGAGLETPAPGQMGMPGVPMTPDMYQAARWEREIAERNRPLADEELDALLPGADQGYKILPPPPGYQPIMTPARKLMGTPTPMTGATPLYHMPEESNAMKAVLPEGPDGLPEMKPEDMQVGGLAGCCCICTLMVPPTV